MTSHPVKNPSSPTRSSLWQPWIRVLALGLGFMFIFTNFSALQNLESSLFLKHADPGIGSTTIAILYACAAFGCTISPFVLQIVGTKWCLVFGALSHALFTSAHFCSSYFTLFPAAALLGVATGIVWTSQGKSVTRFAEDLAASKGVAVEGVVSLFNGVFFCCFMCAQIWGNLISSFVLESDSAAFNFSVWNSSLDVSRCGANFCPDSSSNSSSQTTSNVSSTACTVPDSQVQLVFVIFLAFVTVGFVLFLIFMPNLSRLSQAERGRTSCKELATTLFGGLVFTFQDVKALLLAPLFFYTGYEQALLAGDFNAAFVSCLFGIETIGFVMLAFGICDTIASLLAGQVAKFTGQTGMMLIGVVIQGALLLLMQFKTPSLPEKLLLFVIAGLWGVGDAIWQTQTSSMVGVVFAEKQEMGFACYRLWQQLGFAFSFGTSPRLCTYVSFWLGLGVLILSTLGLGVVELMQRKKRRTLDVAKSRQREGVTEKFDVYERDL